MKIAVAINVADIPAAEQEIIEHKLETVPVLHVEAREDNATVRMDLSITRLANKLTIEWAGASASWFLLGFTELSAAEVSQILDVSSRPAKLAVRPYGILYVGRSDPEKF